MLVKCSWLFSRGVSSRPRDSSETFRIQSRENSLSITLKVPFANSWWSGPCERDFERDGQRVCLWILKISEESLGRDKTPRQTSHEHSQVFDNCLLLYKHQVLLGKYATKTHVLMRVCTYWLTGRGVGRKNIWLEVRTYGPNAAKACVLTEN